MCFTQSGEIGVTSTSNPWAKELSAVLVKNFAPDVLASAVIKDMQEMFASWKKR
jgi:hypothetical protein